jgi:hypothetical protein
MHRDGAVHATTVHERLDYARIVLVYHQRPERINVLEVHRHAMANRITIIAGPACRAGRGSARSASATPFLGVAVRGALLKAPA